MQKMERPELDEEANRRAAYWLLLNAKEQGFFSYGLLSQTAWEQVVESQGAIEVESSEAKQVNRDSLRSGVAETEQLQAESSAVKVLKEHYHLLDARAMLVVALRYAPDIEAEAAAGRAERGLPPLPLACYGQPAAKVARFARGNWYREIMDRLGHCAVATFEAITRERLAESLDLEGKPPSRWPRFVNSRFPEKALALAAGLGTIGRNSLLIAKKTNDSDILNLLDFQEHLIKSDSHNACIMNLPIWSSAVVIGLMLLPFDVKMEKLEDKDSPRGIAPSFFAVCSDCRLCIDACPSRALSISSIPGFERYLCIQNYSSIEGNLPDFINNSWTDQLYGCDLCLEACPYFEPDEEAHVNHGRIGGFFDAGSLANLNDEQIRVLFKGSALDQKWISPKALRRNAAIIAKKA
ncbi:MAG TPA: 4Fe-4S double cluster binding domain-containing protein [Rectinema sp.]|nr:4Fe-4S double cluster binding domain-containing protein [Rectinema sp.]